MNCQGYDGQTALHLSSGQGLFEIVKALVEVAGINVNLVDHFATTPLMCAILHSPKDSKVKVVSELLAHKDLDVNFQDKKTGETALYLACRGLEEEREFAIRATTVTFTHGLKDIVKLLLADERTDVTARNAFSTVLKWATSPRKGWLTVVEAVLERERERIKQDKSIREMLIQRLTEDVVNDQFVPLLGTRKNLGSVLISSIWTKQ